MMKTIFSIDTKTRLQGKFTKLNLKENSFLLKYILIIHLACVTHIQRIFSILKIETEYLKHGRFI